MMFMEISPEVLGFFGKVFDDLYYDYIPVSCLFLSKVESLQTYRDYVFGNARKQKSPYLN